MPEQAPHPEQMNMGDILTAADNGELGDVRLPTIIEHPWDTSMLTGEPSPLPEGFVDVRDAAAEGFTGWERESVVVGTFRFSVDQLDTSLYVVAESTEPGSAPFDPKLLATFNLGPLGQWSDIILSGISQLGLRRFVGAIKVVDSQSPDGKQYTGVLDHVVHALEQPFDGDYDTLQESQRVLIEGKVSAYQPKTIGSPDTPALIVVRQADGRLVEVSLSSFGRIDYGSSSVIAGGSNELTPPYPMPGDSIQLPAVFHRPAIVGVQGILLATHSKSAHLMRGYHHRVTTEWSERSDAHELIREVGTLGLNAASKLIGHTIAAKVASAAPEAPFVLSDVFRRQLSEALSKKLPAGENLDDYQPLAILPNAHDYPARLLHYFGAETLQMTKEEFKMFAMDVCYGNHFLGSKEAVNELFAQFSSDHDALWRLSFAAVSSFYERYRSADPEDPALPPPDYADALLRNALKHLQSQGYPNFDAEVLVDLSLDVFKSDSAFPNLRKTVADTLLTSLIRCGKWDQPLVTTLTTLLNERNVVDAITATRGLHLYKEAMPDILTALEALNQETSRQTADGETREEFRYHLDKIQLAFAKLIEAQNRPKRR